MIHQDNAKNVQSLFPIASFAYQHYNAHSAHLVITFTIPHVSPVKLVSILHIFTLILCCKHVLDALLLATPASIRLIALPVFLAICSTAIALPIVLRITITWEVCALNANFLA